LARPKKWRKKGAKGLNALWIPAKLVSLAIFWWLPKGVVASAIFAQRNPKISLLLQAGYHFLLHSVPRCKEKGKKNIRVYTASHAALPPRAAGEGSKNAFVKKVVELGCVADGKSLCFRSSRVFSRWHFYLKCQHKI